MGPQAGEYNHMFFAQAMNSIFASHPPVRERVARIERVPDVEAPATGGNVPLHRPTAFSGFTGGVSTASLNEAVDSIGSVNAPAVTAASEVIRSIPNGCLMRRDLERAGRAWHSDGALRPRSGKRQLNLIESTLEPGHESYLQIMESKIKSLHPFKLQLLDLCIPSSSQHVEAAVQARS